MHYTRLYVDEDGQTRFEDCETSFGSRDFAPPAPPIDVSAAVPVSEMMFIRFSAGWTDALHPAPARQWMLVLAGRGESTASGDVRSWGPGDVFLLEDTSPPGHGTTIHEDALFAVIRC